MALQRRGKSSKRRWEWGPRGRVVVWVVNANVLDTLSTTKKDDRRRGFETPRATTQHAVEERRSTPVERGAQQFCLELTSSWPARRPRWTLDVAGIQRLAFLAQNPDIDGEA